MSRVKASLLAIDFRKETIFFVYLKDFTEYCVPNEQK